VPDVVQISTTILSSELFNPSHHPLMKYLYFNNISETLQMRWKKTTYLRSSARYLLSNFILQRHLGASFG